MDLLNQIIAFLNKPFPEQQSRFGTPKTALVISLFITFFLYIFKPFGLDTLGPNAFWICLGFGSMTFFTSIIYEYIVGQVLKLKGERDKWTFWKWVVSSLGLVLFISLANFLFARLVIFGYIDWRLFPAMMYGTFMVGLIPFLMLGSFSLLLAERKFQEIASEINQQEKVQTTESPDNESTIFGIPLSKIRYAEALQNYVKIGHIDYKGEFTTKTERSTLKQILEETKGANIVKCHRSFLVNRNAIISAGGNAQGLLLTLSDCDTLLPVSRSYIKEFR